MKDKKQSRSQFSQDETKLMEQLRQHPEIMARVQSILEIASNQEGPLKTADEVEELLIEEVRRLGGATLHHWANQAEERVSSELKSQDPAVRSRKKKTLKWWCVFGLVEVRERIWRSPTRSYLRPLPQRLGVTPRGRSKRLERALTDFGCEHSFGRAVESVREHYGFEIGASAVRSATLVHAQRARAKLEEEYRQPFRILPAEGAAHVIAEADGTMICTVQPGERNGKRPREWKKMRLLAAQAKDSATTVYAATFGSVAETGRRWGHCARQAGWGNEEAPVRNGYRYLNNRWDCLDYPRALKLGLPIGSGMIESGHRHVLHARLKKAGTAWLPDHADQIAHLRVLRANHKWDSLWN